MNKYRELSGKTESQKKERKKLQHTTKKLRKQIKHPRHSRAPEAYFLVFKYAYLHI